MQKAKAWPWNNHKDSLDSFNPLVSIWGATLNGKWALAQIQRKCSSKTADESRPPHWTSFPLQMGVLPDNARIEIRFFLWLRFLKLALKWIVIGSAIVLGTMANMILIFPAIITLYKLGTLSASSGHFWRARFPLLFSLSSFFLATQVADACECGNEPSGSVKCGEFLD